MDYFKKMINVCGQMNYSKFKSEEYEGFRKQLQELIEERKHKKNKMATKAFQKIYTKVTQMVTCSLKATG